MASPFVRQSAIDGNAGRQSAKCQRGHGSARHNVDSGTRDVRFIEDQALDALGPLDQQIRSRC